MDNELSFLAHIALQHERGPRRPKTTDHAQSNSSENGTDAFVATYLKQMGLEEPENKLYENNNAEIAEVISLVRQCVGVLYETVLWVAQIGNAIPVRDQVSRPSLLKYVL